MQIQHQSLQWIFRTDSLLKVSLDRVDLQCNPGALVVTHLTWLSLCPAGTSGGRVQPPAPLPRPPAPGPRRLPGLESRRELSCRAGLGSLPAWRAWCFGRRPTASRAGVPACVRVYLSLPGLDGDGAQPHGRLSPVRLGGHCAMLGPHASATEEMRERCCRL